MTADWTNKLLAGSYLAEPEILVKDPTEDRDLTDPQKLERLPKDYENCTAHIRQLYSNNEQIGRRIRSLVSEVIDISDIALAEWSRLRKDSDIVDDALRQLVTQAKSNFCPSSSAKEWASDVYGLFKALTRVAKQGTDAKGYAFSVVMLNSYPISARSSFAYVGPCFENGGGKREARKLCRFLIDRQKRAAQ